MVDLPGSEPLALSVSEFVAYLNQTLEFAYPSVVISGELANYRVSKNRWVYFDLKDDSASVRFFGTVYQLAGPMEDGMLLSVRGMPRLHPLYNFSVTVQQIQLVGEGTIKRAASLLEAKLAAEGLFAADRKRALPYPPTTIGLITSAESAAYADFTKIINARWAGLDIMVANVQVQGAPAPSQIVAAIQAFNQQAEPPEVLVLVRGGGSAEDLQAFSDEAVVRAVAGSRIPTLVAIGHEVDVSLAELAADQRGSTPSNAAELLVPDKTHVLQGLKQQRSELERQVGNVLRQRQQELAVYGQTLAQAVRDVLVTAQRQLGFQQEVLAAYNPQLALTRGYALVRQAGQLVTHGRQLKPGAIVDIELHQARLKAEITQVRNKGELNG